MSTPRIIAAALCADIDRHVPRIHVHSPDLKNALRTLNRAGSLPGGVEVTVEQAVECWRLVQYVRELPGALPEQFAL